MSKSITNEYVNELINNHNTFRTKNNDAYIVIPGINPGTTKHVCIGESDFNDFIELDHIKRFNEAISSNIKSACTRLLIAMVRQQSQLKEILYRAGYINNTIYLDKDGSGLIFKISAKGFKKIKSNKYKFKQSNSISSLPNPDTNNATLTSFWSVVNIKNKHDKTLVITWMLFTYFIGTNKPILVFTGEKGSAKSYSQGSIMKILDPGDALLRSPPKLNEDIAIAAANSHIISYHNISKLTPRMQDEMCLVSTGGTYANRKKFSDREEVSTGLKRSMMLNGIGNFITADDLQQRCIFISLDEIPRQHIKTELDLDKTFEDNKEAIFGWIVNSLIKIMKHIKSTETPKSLERMADFYHFGHVVEMALNRKKGLFKKAFQANLIKQTQKEIDSSPIAQSIIELKNENLLPFKGTMNELLNKLKNIDPSISMEARKLSAFLKPLRKPILETHNILISETTRSGPGNKLTISCKP